MKLPIDHTPNGVIYDADGKPFALSLDHAAIVADVVNQAHAVVTADRQDDEWAYLAALSQLARAVRALEAL